MPISVHSTNSGLRYCREEVTQGVTGGAQGTLLGLERRSFGLSIEKFLEDPVSERGPWILRRFPVSFLLFRRGGAALVTAPIVGPALGASPTLLLARRRRIPRRRAGPFA